MTQTQENKIRLSNIDKAYFAGVIDSDGCIRIQRNLTKKGYRTYVAWVQIAQIDYQALQELADKFDINSLTEFITKNGRKFKRVIFTGKKAYKFLKQIKPFLRIKAKQAEIVLEFEKLIGKHHIGRKYKVPLSQIKARDKLVERIKKLNGR